MDMNNFKQYRKLPVIIKARVADREEFIETLEGTMKANIGDYIICGLSGELYPCKPDIFKKSYEEVND